MKTDLNVTKIGGVNGVGAKQQPASADKSKGPSFKDTLETQMDDVAKQNPIESKGLPKTLKFSNHAVERMSQRGIRFTPEEMVKIEDAARKAAEKGAKETLIFTDENALIVSSKNDTIVTVMDKNTLKENVFTNIDSTVVI